MNLSARNNTLMKENKDKLCGWLEVFVCMFEDHAVPLLDAAYQKAKRV